MKKITIYPKITVITPSYNQGLFIEDTIKSVLMQGYPNLEYLLIDGGSTDRTKEVITKYANSFAYFISEPDKGQANAINKGIKRANGDIICWLNSDDLLEKNALWKVGQYFLKNQPYFLYGDGWRFYNNSFLPRRCCKVGLVDANTLSYIDPIHQPSTFWSHKVIDEVGLLDENLNYALDWEFFIRISQKFELNYLPTFLSSYRIHKDHKTGTGGYERAREIISLVEKYASLKWRSLYLDIFQNYTDIEKIRKIGNRFYSALLATRYPRLFMKYDFADIDAVIRVLIC